MQIVQSLAEVSDRYRALFVDLWGCVHDGIRPFPGACEALVRYREGGGRVILVTNAPRPRSGVAEQIGRIGVPETAWDDIATSGDAARVALFQGVIGRRVWHMGPEMDLGFFDTPTILADPVAIERVPLSEADGIACTGPVDPHADPQEMRATLTEARLRGLKLLCANPDIVVDRGGRREYCAGAYAALYTELGGESLYFGKPHPPIYDLARRRLAAIEAVDDADILAIGDGPGTDARGAIGEGLDLMFISGGLGARDTRTAIGGSPDPDALDGYLRAADLDPTYVIGTLR